MNFTQLMLVVLTALAVFALVVGIMNLYAYNKKTAECTRLLDMHNLTQEEIGCELCGVFCRKIFD